MSSIVIVAGRSTTAVPLSIGQTFFATAYVVVDNAGNTLPAGTLNGSESPPWTATLTGTDGPGEASVTFTDLDSTGATIGTPVTITESGSGGVVTPPPPFFPVAATGSSITVTG
jgi:hypothetical protein